MIGPFLVGMETSGRTRDALRSRGIDAVSADILPTTAPGPHILGDVFSILDGDPRSAAFRPWIGGLFHPTCTFHVVSAAWAFSDPDFDRYPGVGYHQRVKPGTLVGAARREARDAAEADVERIKRAPFWKVIENPRGTIATRTSLGAPSAVVQPYEYGDDASKATCLWAFDAAGAKTPILLPPTRRVPGRMVERPLGSGRFREYWSNQTDTGQNRESPSADRWSTRSETYPGIAEALADAIALRLKGLAR